MYMFSEWKDVHCSGHGEAKVLHYLADVDLMNTDLLLQLTWNRRNTTAPVSKEVPLISWNFTVAYKYCTKKVDQNVGSGLERKKHGRATAQMHISLLTYHSPIFYLLLSTHPSASPQSTDQSLILLFSTQSVISPNHSTSPALYYPINSLIYLKQSFEHSSVHLSAMYLLSPVLYASIAGWRPACCVVTHRWVPPRRPPQPPASPPLWVSLGEPRPRVSPPGGAWNPCRAGRSIRPHRTR